MPSVDHCLNKSSEMTTLTNSLEVFDTYKHRDDKDSDEESFHLPLDDDETESKYQDAVMKNGNGIESEDEILNKFESSTSALEPIDSHLEERLLNDEEEEEKLTENHIKENGTHEDLEDNSKENETENQAGNASDHKKDVYGEKDTEVLSNGTEEYTNEIANEDTEMQEPTADGIIDKNPVNDCTKINNNALPNGDEITKNDSVNNNMIHDNVPNVSVNNDCVNNSEESPLGQADTEDKSTHVDIEKCDDQTRSLNSSMSRINKNLLETSSSTVVVDNEPKHKEDQPDDKLSKDDRADKCENSNDSSKSQNEDSEDLFDISIIRDAEEDNAESAYNEAHPEDIHIDENDEYEDRNEDKGEEDCSSDRANNIEEDEEDIDIDMDKNEDHLKNDDVDIEENKLDCEGIKEVGSDVESDSGGKTDLVKEKDQGSSENLKSAQENNSKCRLDEVTGNLIDSDGAQTNLSKAASDGVSENSMNVDSGDSEKRKSLKRGISEDGESGAVKKSKTEQKEPDTKEPEKPKEKLPLRTLLSLPDFMKRKPNKRLTMHDLEEFCLQKICEVIVHKSELGDVHHQLKLQEQLIETMRKEIQQLTKQARDLEIVNKKLMNDLKQQNATQKPLHPLKITRSVGLQVKFTPYDSSMKRRPQNVIIANPAQTAPNRAPRNIPNSANPGIQRQVSSPQKQPQQQQQQQQLPKPNTPLLSQALQNRRATAQTETVNKSSPQTVRPKVPDPKSANPSASVIDLTDEDDKKDKTKTASPKVLQKSIAVPLRTTPMRVNTQGIRLTTSQGKVAPITSVVTSSTGPQVMYVVQSSPQNLNSPLGPKAVVVNFQSTNGVLSSTLNGSAVSVIPKQANTIQLKTVSPNKPVSNNKLLKMSNKHPAPLPSPPVVRVSIDKPLKPIPPKPHLTIRKTDTGIILQWKMPYELDMYEVIASYQLYAYQETSAMPSTDMWRKVGDVKALALPMACTLTQFADKNKYYFAVRPVDIHKRIGVFSEPEEISL